MPSDTRSPASIEESMNGTSSQWASIGNANAIDGAVAASSIGGADPPKTYFLTVKDFGFNLPDGAQNITVSLDIKRYRFGDVVTDDFVQLQTGGLLPDAAQAFDWGVSDDSDTTYTSTDLLGANNLTASQINDPNFGVKFSAQTTGGNSFAIVDGFELTVSWDNPPSTDLRHPSMESHPSHPTHQRL